MLEKIDRYFFYNFFRKLYSLYFIFLHKKIIKNFKYKNLKYECFSVSMENDFSKLCEYYGTNKGYVNPNQKKTYVDINSNPQLPPWDWRKNIWVPHNYSLIYNNLFSHCRNEIKLIFELGISRGSSLRVWRDYLPNAEIYGADIRKNDLFTDERIKTFYVDQLDKESIILMWNEINRYNFDIIVDDGLHTYDANINFFLNSFDKLKKHGIYIIEDVQDIYCEKLFNELKKFNPEIIFLKQNKNRFSDNNMIIIRKD